MASKKDSGTEVRVLTFGASEDAIVPSGWDIVSVEHDRSMAVTRVVVSRPHDPDAAAKEKEEAAADSATATPSYPQASGAAPAPDTDLTAPPTSYTWGTLDTTKVQNLPDLDRVGPPLAVQEAAGKPDEAKDQTEKTGEVQEAANAESADKEHTADNPVDETKVEDIAETKGADNK